MGAGGAVLILLFVLLVLGALAVIGVVLAALGAFSLFGRKLRLVFFGLGVSVLLIPVGGVLAYFTLAFSPPPERDISWDFSRTHQVSQLEGEPTGDYYNYSGDIDLRMQLPDGRSYVGKASHISVRKSYEGDRIESITVKLPEMSKERAYERAGELIREWRLDSQDSLDDWYRDSGTEGFEREDEIFFNSDRDMNPSLSVGLLQTEADRWTISLGVFWESELLKQSSPVGGRLPP